MRTMKKQIQKLTSKNDKNKDITMEKQLHGMDQQRKYLQPTKVKEVTTLSNKKNMNELGHILKDL